VPLPSDAEFTASLALGATASQTINLLAASPGAVTAMGLAMTAGTPLTTYENTTGQHVAVIDTATAGALGISPARLAAHPAIFVNGIAYTRPPDRQPGRPAGRRLPRPARRPHQPPRRTPARVTPAA
jgi:hypothetical protein